MDRVDNHQQQLHARSAHVLPNSPRKTINMSRWIRGIYNATANFNLSNAIRAASGRILGGNTEHVREECNQSNQCQQSCQPNKSNQSSEHACTSHSSRTCNCASGECADNDIGNEARNIPVHVSGCICSLCRDYNEYNEYSSTIHTEGQGTGARIRVGNELKSFKHTNNGTTDDVEHITGIQSGVAI